MRRTITALFLITAACTTGCTRAEAPGTSAAQSTPAAAAPAGQPKASASDVADPNAVAIDGSTTVDGTRYPLRGTGECTYTADAAIYDVPAAQWRATLKADGQAVSYLNVTVWQFKEGRSNETTVGLQIGADFRHLATVKGATIVGSAIANAEHSGTGAVLTVDGTDARGKPLAVKVTCARVTAAVEEGGR